MHFITSRNGIPLITLTQVTDSQHLQPCGSFESAYGCVRTEATARRVALTDLQTKLLPDLPYPTLRLLINPIERAIAIIFISQIKPDVGR